jgi:hypothetical protein
VPTGDDEGDEDDEQMTMLSAAVAGMLKRKRQKAQERQGAIIRAARDKVAQVGGLIWYLF